MSLYYPEDATDYDKDINSVVDFIQERLECCGVNKIDDWFITPYYARFCGLPPSCCEDDKSVVCPQFEAFTDVSDYN